MTTTTTTKTDTTVQPLGRHITNKAIIDSRLCFQCHILMNSIKRCSCLDVQLYQFIIKHTRNLSNYTYMTQQEAAAHVCSSSHATVTILVTI